MAEEDKVAKDDADSGGGIKGIISKVTSSKKMMIIAGSGVLLFLLIIGGAAYYFLSSDKSVDDETVEESVEDGEQPDKSDIEEKSKASFESVHIFYLKPFFLPINLKNNEESGRFLLVTPNFRMSNSRLDEEIYKNISSIREKIYTILRRENLYNLTEKNNDTRERIKKSTRDRTNELLPVGSGVVKEVFFSEFVIK